MVGGIAREVHGKYHAIPVNIAAHGENGRVLYVNSQNKRLFCVNMLFQQQHTTTELPATCL
ncbi:hypothetical protein [Niveispirillum sp.]|uniref:hypothetical protein n=1 Tax=Niveispirillum sp. TaxID=1917217 RepID=UPI001B64CEE5|nr:hypothetical protein [Niveispirillum sp.]MBP7338473.1 hypothetical protein [Niveispirillum sp.]